MTEKYSEAAVEAKKQFAERFDDAIRRDREQEKARGEVNKRVEERRKALYTFATSNLEPELD